MEYPFCLKQTVFSLIRVKVGYENYKTREEKLKPDSDISYKN